MQPRARFAALCLLLAVVTATAGCGRSQPAAAQTASSAPLVAPAATTSFYMNTTAPTVLRQDGCTAGTQAVSGGVRQGLYILDFGQPQSWYVLGPHFGTMDFGSNLDTIAAITAAAEAWMTGYRSCTPNRLEWWRIPHATLGIGTSNYQGATDSQHGMAWGAMINDLNLWARSHGDAYAIQVVGASDMEVNWNSPANTIAWVNGYNKVAKASLGSLLYDYGDDANGLNPGNGWTVYDLWYVANGAKLDYPIPEIYYTADATSDWALLSLWAYTHEGRAIIFKGIMTEHAANPATLTPAQGWEALVTALQISGQTADNTIPSVTDMRHPE